MLGKPIVNPVSIAKLLKLNNLDLALKFSENSTGFREWLIEQQKDKTHIPAEVLNKRIEANLIAGALAVKNCKRAWSI